jgi:hypothetical protein
MEQHNRTIAKKFPKQLLNKLQLWSGVKGSMGRRGWEMRAVRPLANLTGFRGKAWF